MDRYSYLLLVDIPASCTVQALAKALQEHYDEGTEGQFRIVASKMPGYLVAFERTTRDDDPHYLRLQMQSHGCSIQQAAMHQLADELGASEFTEVDAITECLRAGDAQVLDFSAVLTEVTKGEEPTHA